jgi:hypothetical protein
MSYVATDREDRLRKEEEEKDERLCREQQEREERQILMQQLIDIQSKNASKDEVFQPAKIELPPYDDKEDLDLYLTQFERLTEVMKWKRDTWAICLLTRLRGKAREVLDKLPAETATKDYDELKRALLARFQLTADTYRVKFRTARKEN